jgi:3-deoxy-7-phosphoheptulonate synthase
MLRAYSASAITLNLLRAYTRGGYADLRQVHAWNKDFVRRSPAGQRYEQVARDIDRALDFMPGWARAGYATCSRPSSRR